MQIPAKYIFFIKERIKESKLFLNRITISNQKRDDNTKSRINTYKNIIKEQKIIINKLKNEASNRIAYAKSEEIQTLIKNNGEIVNNEIEGIKKRIINHKEKLSQIKKSLDKKENNKKSEQKTIKQLSDEIKKQEKSNQEFKEKIKEASIKAKKNKKKLATKKEAKKDEDPNRQAPSLLEQRCLAECEDLHETSEEIINKNINLNKLSEARNIYLILMAKQISAKSQHATKKDVFIENTANNLSSYGKSVNQDINDKKEKAEKMIAENSELENEVTNCKQDLETMEETNRRNSGDSLGGASFFVSFSDIISVLLCFFILFFAISKLDGAKAQQLASTFVEQKTKKIVFNAYASKSDMDMLVKVKELMLDNVSPEAITESKTKTIKHIISGADLFSPGNTEISDDGIELLKEKLINDLNVKVMEIIVEGHTDDKELFAFPEKMKKYGDNIGLSAARAVTVAKFIEENLNSSKNIIGIRAYGSNRPLKANTSDLFRALNRRVVIKIIKENIKENKTENKTENKMDQ
jgi:chemotaxis protein MotB